MTTPSFDVVVPTIGRASLRALLESLAASDGPRPGAVILVDDRRDRAAALAPLDGLGWVADRVRVVAGRAAGPASARNAGWRASCAEWVAFHDDDVVVTPRWLAALAGDLAAAADPIAGTQGRVVVPLPRGRRPTDWERNVAGLERAYWATADMAYRRAVLARVGGFDERFPHAYREDADLALRVLDAGSDLVRGRRQVLHPVPPADVWTSVRLQRGNGDDVLMRALHGPHWRDRAHAPAGRLARHAVTVAAAALAAGARATRHRRVAAAGAVAWVAGTSDLAWARIAPGPRTAREIATMVATSALLPFAAVTYRVRGYATLRSRLADRERAPQPVRAVLLDRDGTLVVDVPYNGDPARVRPMTGAADALARLRDAGVALAVVSNQSGVARGMVTPDQVAVVNARVDDELGPLGPFCVCSHGDDDDCACRKPKPGLVLEAARRLGVRPQECVVIGDTGADVDAARNAGARAILVPNAATRAEEIAAAPVVASDLANAVDLLLGAAATDSREEVPA